MDSRYFSFPINPSEDSTYYMRIQGAGSQFILTLSTLRKLHSSESREGLVYGLFFGLVMAMIAYNFFIFVTTKGRSFILYVLFVGFLGLVLGILQGFTQKFIFQDFPWFSNNGFFHFAGWALLLLILFTISFLKLKEKAQKVYKYMVFFSVLALTLILTTLFLPLIFNVYFTIINTILIFLAVITSGVYRYKMNYPPASYFLWAFGSQLIGIIVYVFVLMGLFPTCFIFTWAPTIGCALQLIILSIGLANKFNLMKKEALFQFNLRRILTIFP